MRNKAKVFLSILLVFAMVAGLLPLPAVNRTVQAAGENGTGKAIQLVKNGTAPNITGAQTSVIHFGNYRQSSPTASSTYKAHIKWRVLENANGQLFLLSDKNLDIMNYNQTSEIVTWETSTIRSWLNAYGTSSVESSYAPFLRTAFNAKEQAAIAVTQVKNSYNSFYETGGDNDTNDKVFLLSLEEVMNTAYGFTNDTGATETRTAENTAYVAGGGNWGTADVDSWWLRTYSRFSNYQSKLFVTSDGSFLTDLPMPEMFRRAVRPALKIDLSQVLFTSATAPEACTAPGGKTANGANVGPLALVPVENYTGNSWKLTLFDPARNGFKASYEGRNGNEISVKYSGAVTGTNEYISAIITDVSGAITFYGRIKKLTGASLASGSVTIDVSGKMNAGDRLYVFNEQHNGTHRPKDSYYHDFDTDYASNLQQIAPVVIDSVALTMGDRIDANIYLKVPEEAAKAVITYSYPGWKVPEVQEYVFANMKADDQGRYQLDVINIPAKELIETMTLRVYDRNGNLIPLSMQTAVGRMTDANTYVFSSTDYANVVVAKGNEQQRKQAKALLNYGSMVQRVLSHKTGTLAASAAILTKMATEMNAIQVNHNYDGVLPTGTVKENLGYQSLSLNLEGEIQILLSFSKRVTATMNGKALQVQWNGSSYEVVIPHIRAKNMDIIHEVEVSYGTTSFTFQVCALTYANRILATANAPQPYTNLAKAMYIYQQETLNLFGR